jgi:hypothetical protein
MLKHAADGLIVFKGISSSVQYSKVRCLAGKHRVQERKTLS